MWKKLFSACCRTVDFRDEIVERTWMYSQRVRQHAGKSLMSLSTVLRSLTHPLHCAPMTITNWPTNERPREKLAQLGPQALSDAELLAIFFRTGVRGKTAVDLARDMLQEFGGLRQLLEANINRFCQQHGLGLAKYAQLQAALEIGRRHLQEKLVREDVMTNSIDTKQYLLSRLRQHQQEVFACLYLDSQHRVIRFEELFHGSIDNATVHPREIVKRALTHNAAAVILAHNHPSGIAKPSQADQHITQQIVKALALVDIRVIDHMIVGDTQVCSMAELGML
jgi:DNA repair protein RadC